MGAGQSLDLWASRQSAISQINKKLLEQLWNVTHPNFTVGRSWSSPTCPTFFNTMITGVFLIVYTTFEGEAYRYIIVFVHFGYTSGAAQGGGRSFKDRKL